MVHNPDKFETNNSSAADRTPQTSDALFVAPSRRTNVHTSAAIIEAASPAAKARLMLKLM